MHFESKLLLIQTTTIAFQSNQTRRASKIRALKNKKMSFECKFLSIPSATEIFIEHIRI